MKFEMKRLCGKSFIGVTLLTGALLLMDVKVQGQTDSIHISLSKAIEMALSETPTMRIADRNVSIKQYYKKEQIAALFPDASLSASYNRTLLKQEMAMEMNGEMVSFKVGQDNTYSTGISLSLPVVAPALWSAVKLSAMDVELAQESARSSKLEMVNQVKQAYYTYLLSKQSYDVLQKSYANMQASNDLVTRQYEQELVSEFEKLRSDVALQNQRPQVTSAAKAMRLSYMRLKVVLGLNIDEPVIFDGDLADYEQEVQSAQVPDGQTLQLAYNSALRQLDLSLKQLEQSKKIQKASSCPTLALAGSFQYSGMGDDKQAFNNYPYSYVALSLNVPIMSWVSTSYKLKQTDLNIENMKDQRTDTEKNLRISIQSNLDDMQQAIEDYASDKETMLQAQKAYDIAKRQYEVGLNTWLDLNNAELTMISTQLTFAQSVYNYLVAKASLDATLGNE